MKTILSILLFLTCSLVLNCVPCLSATPSPSTAKLQARTQLNDVLFESVSYCFKRVGLRKVFCCIDPKVGSVDSKLAQKIKRLGIKVVDKSWIRAYDRPQEFQYLEVTEVKWPSRKRAKVIVYFALAAHDMAPVLNELQGTLYLDSTKHGWVIDNKGTSILPGE